MIRILAASSALAVVVTAGAFAATAPAAPEPTPAPTAAPTEAPTPTPPPEPTVEPTVAVPAVVESPAPTEPPAECAAIASFITDPSDPTYQAGLELLDPGETLEGVEVWVDAPCEGVP